MGTGLGHPCFSSKSPASNPTRFARTGLLKERPADWKECFSSPRCKDYARGVLWTHAEQINAELVKFLA
jgi:hypothetical protein